jgi:IS1 family transposase
LARAVVATTRRRTKGQTGVPYLTDGWTPYAETIKESYRDREVSAVNPRWAILKPTKGITLTQAVKHRKGRCLERIEVRAVIGEPVELPYTVHLDRLHGTLRDRLNCLTRKTHGFAKEVATWDALFSLAVFEHNWLRPHIALRRVTPEPYPGRRYDRRSPAMVLALADHVWSWDEFLRLPLEPRAIRPNRRARPGREHAELPSPASPAPTHGRASDARTDVQASMTWSSVPATHSQDGGRPAASWAERR